MVTDNEIWEQMLSGVHYDAGHPYLIRKLQRVRDMLWKYNALRPSDADGQKAILHSLLGSHGERLQINQPFRCDYGENIFLGEDFFANFNLTILDEGRVEIGNHCFIGPNVSMYTACHPTEVSERNALIEWAEPIKIGDNVWIGGNVVILPGVTIGDNCTIGAGSVVVHDIPSDSVAVGNPCHVVRTLA